MKLLCRALTTIGFVLGTSAIAAPQLMLEDVGQVSLQNSGSESAQQAFHHGLAQLHNFEYASAASDFREAQTLDPDFALAYWGEAMTHNHPIWMRQDRETALSILERLGPTPEARRDKAGTELEKDLLSALDILFGSGEKQARDDRYSAFLGELYELYPGNVEVASFYALSLMGTAHEGRDFATYMRAAAIMQDFIVDYPQHPGVAHYLIHATDDPIHAPLGLRAAQAYSDIAPNAAHAQHMTSHIFLALGDWDGVIKANTRATDLINRKRTAEGRLLAGCGHYPSWLMYGYLQQAKLEAAEELMLQCRKNVEDSAAGQTSGYYAWQRALYLFDTGRWDGDIANYTFDFGERHKAALEHRVIDGWVALKRENIAVAQAALADAEALAVALQAAWDAQGIAADQPSRKEPAVHILQLRAMITLVGGDTALSLSQLREAVAMEMDLPFGFGPPSPPKPSLELLGETLLALGQYAEAIEALRASLARTPEKLASVAALARAEARMAEQVQDAAN
ncbi:MAG: hypothetical protein AAF270_11420 [Pseudomonadota bacterium]